jgi:hypothetical protein
MQNENDTHNQWHNALCKLYLADFLARRFPDFPPAFSRILDRCNVDFDGVVPEKYIGKNFSDVFL